MVTSASLRLSSTADSSNILAVYKTLVAMLSLTKHATVVLAKVFFQAEHLIGPHLKLVPKVRDERL